jgi:Tol biopolymer transport system component
MFAAATPQDGPGVDLIDLNTGLVTPLVTDTYVLEPRWTEDGTLIIHRVEAGDDTITTFDPETGLGTVPLITSAPLSAPDVKGDTLVFSRNSEVVVCTAPCTTEARAFPGGALITALAPGASRMLAWNPLVTRLEDVQTSIVSLTRERTMEQVVSLPGEGLWLPRWSPDATRLVLTSVEGRLVVVDIATGVRMDLGPGDAPAWSPNGTMIAFAGASAGLEFTTRNIHVVRANGTEERQRLTDGNDEQFYVSPSWSPDGQQILFVELDSGQLFIGTVPER